MIKARGGNVVLLGLSRINCERMLSDLPIRFDGEAVGIPGTVFIICAGETEQALAQQLREAGVLDGSTQIDDRWEAGRSKAHPHLEEDVAAVRQMVAKLASEGLGTEPQAAERLISLARRGAMRD